MDHGVRFVDVLEDKLRALAWEAPVADEPRRYAAPPRFVVCTPLYNLHTVTLDADVRSAHVSRSVVDSERSHEPQPARTEPAHSVRSEPVVLRVPDPRSPGKPVRLSSASRRLTMTQQRSLDAFNQLGASVGVDFSSSDLRSAFRLLARRYHPDRHPGATEPDRRRLSQQFTIVRRSYETLVAALEAPIA